MNPLPTQAVQLRDIHMPPTPDLWPPAPGWWVLGVLVLMALLGMGAYAVRRYRRYRRRRELLNTLDGLGAHSGGQGGACMAAEVSALLKRVALMRFPRHEVASLTGPAWLAFLDHTGGDGRFETGPGRVLATGPYAPRVDLERAELLALARHWVRRNT